MFRTRGGKRPDGRVVVLDDAPSIAKFTDRGARVAYTTDTQAFLDGMFLSVARYLGVTTFERGLPNALRRTEDGKE